MRIYHQGYSLTSRISRRKHKLATITFKYGRTLLAYFYLQPNSGNQIQHGVFCGIFHYVNGWVYCDRVTFDGVTWISIQGDNWRGK